MIKEDRKKPVAVIVSKDGMVDVYPDLKPQIKNIQN